jgi:hypothetical protein
MSSGFLEARTADDRPFVAVENPVTICHVHPTLYRVVSARRIFVVDSLHRDAALDRSPWTNAGRIATVSSLRSGHRPLQRPAERQPP